MVAVHSLILAEYNEFNFLFVFLKAIQDWHLALAVLCLVVIDVLILGMNLLILGVKGELEVGRVANRENPEELRGVS